MTDVARAVLSAAAVATAAYVVMVNLNRNYRCSATFYRNSLKRNEGKSTQ